MKQWIFLGFILTVSGCLHSQSVSDIITDIQSGNIEAAQTKLKDLEVNRGRKADVLFLKGMMTKSAEEAWLLYTEVIREFPTSSYAPKAQYRLAQMKYAQGLYKSALQEFLTVIQSGKQDKLSHDAHYWASQCHFAMNNQDSAVVYLERLLMQSPSLELVLLAQKELTALNIESPFATQIPAPKPPAITPERQAPVTITENDPAVTAPGAEANTDKTAANSTTPRYRAKTLPSEAQFTVQVGAFSNRNNALARKDFFETKGYTVEILQRPQGTGLFLVWVGVLNTEKEARNLQAEFKNKFDAQTTLVRN